MGSVSTKDGKEYIGKVEHRDGGVEVGSKWVPNENISHVYEGICWIATAYYGDVEHSDIQTLRIFRDKLCSGKWLGVIFRILTKGYYLTGQSSFGKWWGKGTEDIDTRSFR